MKLPVNYDALHFAERKIVREKYIKKQGNLCYHCGQSLSSEPSNSVKKMTVNRKLFPKKFFEYPIHLHHSHDTGMTIGAVHCYCNAVLWQYFSE